MHFTMIYFADIPFFSWKTISSEAASEPIALESHITELTELKEQVCSKNNVAVVVNEMTQSKELECA